LSQTMSLTLGVFRYADCQRQSFRYSSIKINDICYYEWCDSFTKVAKYNIIMLGFW